MTQQKLTPAGGPRIEPISLDGDLKYRATFEVIPTIQLADIAELQLEKPVAEVTSVDVDAMIQNLREQRPSFTAVERAAQDTDRVTVDFKGTVDGQPFEGGEGKGVQIIVGAGRMLPDFEAGLRGAAPGEEKIIEVTFPESYQAAHLAGKRAQFSVTVRQVEERKLPELDDAFCKSYGVEEGGMERLRQEVEDNMKRELAEAVRARVKKQVMDGLLAANPVELPKSMVEAQVRDLQTDTARRSGITDPAQLPPAEAFEDAAKRRVGLTLLVSELVKVADLKVDQSRVQTRFEELAQQYPDANEALRTYRGNLQFVRQMEASVLEDQVVDWVLGRARVHEQPASFKELMNFGA